MRGLAPKPFELRRIVKPGGTVERAAFLILTVAIYSLYFPVSQIAVKLDPIDVSTGFDESIPFVSEWIYVYAAIYFSAVLPIFLIKDRRLFLRMTMAYIALESSALIFFLLFPVQMTLRPTDVPLEGLANWGIHLCYHFDLPVNCFPSLHVGNAILGALACLKVDRLIGVISYVVALLIIVSTMLIKQHYVADAVAGFVLANLCYWIFVRTVNIDDVSLEELRYSRKPCAMVALSFFLMLAVMTGVYHSGWAPWAA